MTLEEERAARERSKSLSLGPQKRALVREVSMSTAFRGKTKMTRLAARPREKEKRIGIPAANSSLTKSSTSDRHGTTLVAATPVKPKPHARRAQTQTQQQQEQPHDKLPMLLDHPGFFAKAVEGGADDDEWTIPSSPDILLLDDDDDDGADAARSRVLAEATPTKRRRS